MIYFLKDLFGKPISFHSKLEGARAHGKIINQDVTIHRIAEGFGLESAVYIETIFYTLPSFGIFEDYFVTLPESSKNEVLMVLYDIKTLNNPNLFTYRIYSKNVELWNNVLDRICTNPRVLVSPGYLYACWDSIRIPGGINWNKFIENNFEELLRR